MELRLKKLAKSKIHKNPLNQIESKYVFIRKICYKYIK